MKMTDRQALLLWNEDKANRLSGTPAERHESPPDKAKRLKALEADFEAWAKYYFPKYYAAEPAPFHRKAAKRIISHPEWFEVRSWSRGMAKSSRAIMEALYLTLTGRKRNVLLVSNTLDHAVELLHPFKTELERNNRIINDYGIQQSPSKWTEEKFKTAQGVQFKALGKGQSPRGTRNENYRPDLILIDDIDSDEEARNPQRIKDGVDWIEQSLLSTRSAAAKKHPLLVLMIGNLISPFCSVSELAKKADKHDLVNIIDKDGRPSWPQYISLEDVARIQSTLSERAFRQEYMNNPMPQGEVFKELIFDTCPPLKSCEAVIIYADPATSNRESAGGSMKAVGLVGARKGVFYVYQVWLGTMGNSAFIDALFAAYAPGGQFRRKQNSCFDRRLIYKKQKARHGRAFD